MAQRMAQRSEAATRHNAWLERIAWHAAALAALGVMLLVLLGSLEWLDHWAPEPKSAARRGRGPGAAARAPTPNAKAVIARQGEPRGHGASAQKLAPPARMGDGEGCAPPSGAG